MRQKRTASLWVGALLVALLGQPAARVDGNLGVAAAQGTPVASPAAETGAGAIEITGLVNQAGPVSVADLQQLPQETVSVTYESGGTPEDHTFTGVRLMDALDHVGLATEPDARNPLLRFYVIVSANDGYQVVLSGGELDPNFGNAPMLLAWEQDGEPLEGENGPLRLVVPGDVRGGRYVHGIVSIDVRAIDETGRGMPDPSPLVIFAPGSLLPVQEPLREAFARMDAGADLRFHPPTYSGLLARQIQEGAAADLFISASWDYLEALRRDGFVPEPKVLAGNRLALLVRPGAMDRVRCLQDLAQPGVRLLIPPPDNDPLGQYTEELFSRAGLSAAVAEKRGRGEVLDDLPTLGARLAAGEVDAAIVYATSARSLGGIATVVSLPEPYDLSDRIVFGAGAVVRHGSRHPAADRFVAFLLEDGGQAILTRAGFLSRHRVSRPGGS